MDGSIWTSSIQPATHIHNLNSLLMDDDHEGSFAFLNQGVSHSPGPLDSFLPVNALGTPVSQSSASAAQWMNGTSPAPSQAQGNNTSSMTALVTSLRHKNQRLEGQVAGLLVQYNAVVQKCSETEALLHQYTEKEKRLSHLPPANFDGPQQILVYWHSETYKKSQKAAAGLSKSEKANKRSRQMAYLVDECGQRVSEDYEKTVLHYTYAFFNQLAVDGKAAETWGIIGSKVKEDFYSFIASRFPPFTLCSHHYKADKLAKQYYPTWRSTHLDHIARCKHDLRKAEVTKAVTEALLDKATSGVLSMESLSGLLLRIVEGDDRDTSRVKTEEGFKIEAIKTEDTLRAAGKRSSSEMINDSDSDSESRKKTKVDDVIRTTIIDDDDDSNVGLLALTHTTTTATTDNTGTKSSSEAIVFPDLKEVENNVRGHVEEKGPDDICPKFIRKNPITDSDRYRQAGLKDTTNAPGAVSTVLHQDITVPSLPGAMGLPTTPPLPDPPTLALAAIPAQQMNDTQTTTTSTFPPLAEITEQSPRELPPISQSSVVPTTLIQQPGITPVAASTRPHKPYKPRANGTARSLCAVDWTKGHPQGSATEYDIYWKGLTKAQQQPWTDAETAAKAKQQIAKDCMSQAVLDSI